MLDIAVLRAMVAKGAAAEMLLTAIEADHAANGDKLAARRANDAERQRRKRSRHVMSRDVTLPVCDPPHALSSTPPLQPSEPKKVLRAGIRHHLPDDWKPKPDIETFPNWQQGLAEMRDWAKSNAIVKADWDATLRNWLRRSDRFNKTNGGQANGRRHGSVLDAGERIAAKLKEMGATGDYIPGSSGPQPLGVDQPMRTNGLRLIPKG